MKIAIKALLTKEASIDKILKKDLPFKLAYRLNKIASKLVSEFKAVQDTRNEMIKKFGKEDDKGNFQVPNNKLKEFTKEWNAFIEEEIEFNTEKIPQECLESVELSAIDITNLFEFIEGDKPKKETK